jgi:hypothetical protein
MTELDSDTRGAAIVGMSMGISLLSVMVSKGVMNDQDVDRYLESVLTSLEGFQEPNDPGVQKARILFDGISQIVRGQTRQPT